MAKHGDVRYSTTAAPHQREPQESLTDKSVQATVLMMASQIGGKTEIFLNAIGYFMEHEPTNVIAMYPTVESAEAFSKKKVDRFIRATPVVSDLVRDNRTRDSGNTIREKQFPGGSLYMVGANSPPSLRGSSGEVLAADEIDSYEEATRDEGDPLELLWKRGESYPQCVKVLASTPTLMGSSRIAYWFGLSDQRFWFVPCPKCGHWFTFKWSLVQWIEGKTETAVILCEKCAAAHDDKTRLAMYHAGQWRPTADFKGIRGYHLNGIYCPWPAQRGYKNRLHQMAEECVRAKRKGTESEKVWVNTFLTECWEDEQEEVKPEPLLQRREPYGEKLPSDICLLTCKVDTQANRLQYEVTGWGVGMESWAIEFGSIFGNPHLPDVWNELDELLAKKWEHASGVQLRIVLAGVDSGGVDGKTQAFADPVYKFVLGHQQASRGRSGVIALKGSSIPGSPMAKESLQKNGINLLLVGTDTAKSTVYDWLRINEPGPRYMHFPDDPRAGFDEEYFKQLTAERIRTKKHYGFTKREWVKVYPRNEALDLRAYDLALLDLLNPDFEALSAQLTPKKVEGDGEGGKSEAESYLKNKVTTNSHEQAATTTRKIARPIRGGFVNRWRR